MKHDGMKSKEKWPNLEYCNASSKGNVYKLPRHEKREVIAFIAKL
jgi:hypothetical protein